jgi:hypothetical protein
MLTTRRRYFLHAASLTFLAWDLWRNPELVPPIVAGVNMALFAAVCGALIGAAVIAIRRLRPARR